MGWVLAARAEPCAVFGAERISATGTLLGGLVLAGITVHSRFVAETIHGRPRARSF